MSSVNQRKQQQQRKGALITALIVAGIAFFVFLLTIYTTAGTAQ